MIFLKADFLEIWWIIRGEGVITGDSSEIRRENRSLVIIKSEGF